MRLIFAVVVLFLSGCTLNDELNIDLPQEKKIYVLEGVLRNHYPLEMTFTESNRINGSFFINPVWLADIQIMQNGQSYFLNNFLYVRSSDSVLVNYYTSAPLNINIGEEVTMRAVSSGDTLTASAVRPKPICLLDCSYNDGVLDILLDNNYHSNERFFRLTINAFLSDSQYESYSDIFNCKNENSKEISIRILLKKRDYRFLSVRIAHINEDYYQYLYSTGAAFNAYFDPFITPTAIKSNVFGGIGIFTVIEETTVTLPLDTGRT